MSEIFRQKLFFFFFFVLILNWIVVAGPPGTGKTATIAASVESWIAANPNGGVIYCCCASNVAAKNIGIALSKIQLDFRLIVSSEFHIGWHEELYGGLGNKLVVSKELKPQLRPQEVSKIMGNVRVVVSRQFFRSIFVLH